MPYVQRNAFGQIDSLHRTEHPGVHEYLPSDDPEVQGFVGPARAPEEFSRLDSDFVRVIEDVTPGSDRKFIPKNGSKS